VAPGAAAAASSAAAPLSTAATVDVVYELARVLDCGLDRRTVQILMALVDAGVYPSALAAVVKELRAQASANGLARPPAPSASSAR
jgi:mitotic-spindle organizing protein 1